MENRLPHSIWTIRVLDYALKAYKRPSDLYEIGQQHAKRTLRCVCSSILKQRPNLLEVARGAQKTRLHNSVDL